MAAHGPSRTGSLGGVQPTPPSPTDGLLSRRGLLKTGVVGAAILAVAGPLALLSRAGRSPRQPRRTLHALSLYEHEIFAAAAARLVSGDARDWPSADDLDVAGKLDGLIARLHPRATKDLRRVLHVFESALTGVVTIGSARTFTTSSPADQDSRLQAWRHSRVALFRSGYQAMKRLSHAIYYSSPEVYPHVGYPGPPAVPQVPA
jgi:hypothetical protein